MIRVDRVDFSDESQLRVLYDVFVPAMTYERVDPPVATFSDFRRSYVPDSSQELVQWLAYVDDRPAGFAGLRLPLLENRELAYVLVAVVPSRRRQGVGSALYSQVVSYARAAGRRSVLGFVGARPGSSAPGSAFAASCGLTLRNTMLRRQLPLPVPADRLDALASKASARSGGYRVESWVSACPEEYASQYAHLKGLLLAEAPSGSVDWEPEKWDVARLREHEARARRLHETTYTTVAVSPSGDLAGHTQISVREDHQGRASQGDTLVLRGHRGHRLGLAVKVANLRAVQSAHPDLTRVTTANAEQNAAMVKVNEDLGFEISEVLHLWQGDLP